VAVALAAADRGAEVVLVACHVEDAVLADAAAHPLVTVRTAGTAAELSEEMGALAGDADVVVMAAAVADYRVAEVSERKLTKEAAEGVPPTLTLVENEDILAGLAARRRPGQLIVGFAAETPAEGETLHERGIRKRRRKGVDLLAVNEVGWSTGFELPENALAIVDASDEVVLTASGTKREVAEALISAILAAGGHDDDADSDSDSDGDGDGGSGSDRAGDRDGAGR
jgi:phosphopantothenoylcysteine decarboxylase/phosphopantothenate--cysteine ligase